MHKTLIRRIARLAAAAAAMAALAMTAQAAVIAVAQEGAKRLDLHDQPGHCLGQARLAVYTDGVQRVPGCWLVKPDAVTVAFLDGDFITVPLAAFRKPQDL